MDDAKRDLLQIVGILVLLWLLWYFTSGPQRQSSHSGLFLYKPEEYYSQNLSQQTDKVLYGETTSNNTQLNKKVSSVNSPLKDYVKINYVSGQWQLNPNQEYIQIMASFSNKEPIRITGWTLIGKKGISVKIGQGAIIPYSGRVNYQTDIYLYPGDTAYIITGESPIGTSFKVNKCTGYFNQFQNFYPYLPQDCPRPENENIAVGLDDKCLNYLQTIPSCKMTFSAPEGFSSQCQIYLDQKINYSTCVDLHKNDYDFYKKEWRIYLNKNEKLWAEKRETIFLKDENGKIIDSYSY